MEEGEQEIESQFGSRPQKIGLGGFVHDVFGELPGRQPAKLP